MKLSMALLIGAFLLLAGCGWWERVTAHYTGWSRICVDGVSYLQFTSGASVEYTPDGKVRTCR
jgi:outer membrane lipopolysaccharide assembly protein LptE/RlpB